MSNTVYLTAITLLATLFIGCGTTRHDDPAIAAQRAKYILAEEPAGAVGVLDARTGQTDLHNVVVVGRVGGPHATWEKGKATFVISDPSVDHDHANQPGHDEDNCPFCKARKKAGKTPDPTAIVQIRGDDGHILPIDAQELLNIREGQLVVVKGSGDIDTIGNLIVAASGVFIRE
jgi:hypothetical protein